MTTDRRKEIWDLMAEHHPEFTREHDVYDDPWAVSALLLGDFLGWVPFEGAQVMDVGANAGIVTAYCALNGCHVKAYEADPDTYAVLTDMLYRNRLIPRVDPVNAAIWTHTGFCPFEGRSYTSDIAHGRNGAVQVLGAGPNGNGDMTPGLPWGNTKNADSSPMIPCISFELALGSQRWDFVKMDIEGAEFQVLLATPERSLRNIDFLQVEFHNGWADDVIYNSVIEKLENIFDSRGPSENGRFHHAQFRRRLP